LVVTTALFDAISGAPRVRNQLLRVVKKSQNRVFQLRIREDGLAALRERDTTCSPTETGAFYGSHSGLDLGVGLIYDEIPYAIFDKSEKLFDTVSASFTSSVTNAT
jgi:hypothetical protein